MTTMSLVPTTEATSSWESSVDLPEKSLRSMFVRYIFKGSKSMSLEELSVAQAALRNRIAKAEAYGFTPRDVLISLLRPAFFDQNHCRCRSCRQWCLICNATGVGY